jgi:hypothetical protein
MVRGMVTENLSMPSQISLKGSTILGIGFLVNDMDRERWCGVVGIIIKEIGCKGRRRAWGGMFISLLETYTSANSGVATSMGKEPLYGQPEINTLENTKTTINTAKEFIILQVEIKG